MTYVGAEQAARVEKALWQTMETAPKDGTTIIAWCVHVNARWATDESRSDWEGPVVAHWIDHNGGGWTWHGHAGRFTHWMPAFKPMTAPNAD